MPFAATEKARHDRLGNELAVHSPHVTEPVVACLLGRCEVRLRDEEIGILREHLAARADGGRQHLGEPAAGRDHVDDRVAGLDPEELHGLDWFAGGVARLVLEGPARRQQHRLHARRLLVLCLCEGGEQAAERARGQHPDRRFHESHVLLLEGSAGWAGNDTEAPTSYAMPLTEESSIDGSR
jgi:hypothetical protein